MKVLDRTWKNCRKMWAWIIENLPDEFSKLCFGGKRDILRNLKIQWLKQHKFTREIEENCFFCDYAGYLDNDDNDCSKCPGCLIDPEFRCYDFNGSNWINDPENFEAELRRLDAIREGK